MWAMNVHYLELYVIDKSSILLYIVTIQCGVMQQLIIVYKTLAL